MRTAAWIFAALAGPAALAGAPAAGQDAAAGEALAEAWCAQCHALPGQNPVSDAVPTLEALARSEDLPPRDVMLWLLDPHPPMPPLDLSAPQIEDILAYLATLRE